MYRLIELGDIVFNKNFRNICRSEDVRSRYGPRPHVFVLRYWVYDAPRVWLRQDPPARDDCQGGQAYCTRPSCWMEFYTAIVHRDDQR